MYDQPRQPLPGLPHAAAAAGKVKTCHHYLQVSNVACSRLACSPVDGSQILPIKISILQLSSCQQNPLKLAKYMP